MTKLRNFLFYLSTIILPQSLWSRMLLLLFVILLLFEVLVLSIFYDRHWRFVNYKLADNIATEIAYLYQEMEQNPDFLVQYKGSRNINFDMNVVVEKGNQFEGRNALPDNRQTVRLNRSLKRILEQPYYIKYYITNDDKTFVAIGVPSQIYANDVYVFLLPEGRVYNRTIGIFISWMTIGGLAILLIAVVFVYWQMRPMAKVARLADDVGKGRMWGDAMTPTILPLRGAREIRLVARSFNQMIERIYHYLKQRTIMLAGVSHDLRTPLTKMKLNLAVLNDNKDAKEQKKIIQQLEHNIYDMDKMIELYLRFAKGEGDEKLQQVYLKKNLVAIIDAWQKLAKKNKKSVSLSYQLQDNQKIWVREQAIKRCLDNIINNGLENANRVMVKVYEKTIIKTQEKFVVIDVIDNGAGISPDEKNHIFDVFYKVRKDKKQKSKLADKNQGYGLGLAIAKDIVLAHGGYINVHDNEKGGAIFSITLPL